MAANTHLEDGGAVGCPPRIQQIVLAGADEPLAASGKLEREHATLVQVQLVLVRLVAVQHLDVRVLHADGQPLARRAVTQREDLRREVVLLQLPTLPQVPRSHCVVQTT